MKHLLEWLNLEVRNERKSWRRIVMGKLCTGKGKKGFITSVWSNLKGADVEYDDGGTDFHQWSCFYSITPKKKVSKPIKSKKIESIYCKKLENGWEISINDGNAPYRVYIAKNLSKFIEKKTK